MVLLSGEAVSKSLSMLTVVIFGTVPSSSVDKLTTLATFKFFDNCPASRDDSNATLIHLYSTHKYIILVTCIDGVSNPLNPRVCVEMAHNVSGGIVDPSLARTVTTKLTGASLDVWKKKGANADYL